MVKRVFSKLFLSVAVVSLMMISSGCKTEKETTYWDAVQLSNAASSIALLITSSKIPPAGDFGIPNMEKVVNGEVSGVDKERFFYMSIYPQVSDPLYTHNGEPFLFQFDESGDGSFENYPSFVNNMTNHSFELDDFHADIIDHQNEVQTLRVGNLVRSSSGVLNMYVKLHYLNAFSEKHSVAIYLYEKEKIAPQATIANGVVDNFVHRNVFTTAITPLFGKVIDGSFDKDHVTELPFEYDYGNGDLTNLGILTVVYKLDSNNEPIGVYTVYAN